MTWICPACSRQVPESQSTCRCGQPRHPQVQASGAPNGVPSIGWIAPLAILLSLPLSLDMLLVAIWVVGGEMLLFRIAGAIGMFGALLAVPFGLFLAEPALVLIVAIESFRALRLRAVSWQFATAWVAAVLHTSAVVFALNHVPTRH